MARYPVLAVCILWIHAHCMASNLTETPPPRPLVPGSQVICLYDSSEGTSEHRNPLSGEVASAITKMGFDIKWRDIARDGLPRVESLAGARAVVTGFLDGKMNNASAYATFVRDVVHMGVRFVIIGNYGAWQESKTDAFLPYETVNTAFSALGVRYDAMWTDDPSLLTIEVLDPALGDRTAVRPDDVRHFYQFSPLREDVQILVQAIRKDAPGGVPPSAVVFTSATGAMALSRYLSGRDLLDDPGSSRLNVASFIRTALARIPMEPSSLLVLHDSMSQDSERAMRALSVVSAYARIPIVSVDRPYAGDLRPVDLLAHAGVLLALTEVQSPTDGLIAGLLRDVLGRGRRVVSLLPLSDQVIAPVITQGGPTRARPVKGYGLRFNKGIFPGLEGIEVSSFAPTTLLHSLGKSCEVLAESQSEAGPIPIWWRCAAGRGMTVGLNAFELIDRAALGIVLQATTMAMDIWAMPVLGATIEFVDDCPLPMTGNVYEAMGGPDTQFYVNEFYGMVRDAVQKLRIKPTFLAVFSYDEKIAPPFDEPLAGIGGVAARELARMIISDDMPVGLHGTNHVSPAIRGGVTKHFLGIDSLREWFSAGRDFMKAIFGSEARVTVYVPPNDWIDEAGKDALVAAVPEIQVLSTVFNGTEVETEQDFGPDPHHKGLINLPRTWAGYFLEGEAVLGMVNGVLLYGVSSHFIHPDDVLDPERSGGKTWRELKEAYIKGLQEVRRRFPFLREMTALEAASEIRRLSEVGFGTTMHPFVVRRTSGETGPIMFMVRTSPRCSPLYVNGGEVVHSDSEAGVHFVLMKQRVMGIRCGNSR